MNVAHIYNESRSEKAASWARAIRDVRFVTIVNALMEPAIEANHDKYIEHEDIKVVAN